MYEALGQAILKTGETVQAGVVIGPDAEWAERIEELLSHKGDPWNWQNSQALRNPLGIDVYYYLLHRNGVPFANIMTAELAGVGHLGHVWTQPEDRQKGASSSLMSLQMEDFRSRKGKALFLGTGYDSVPYHMYSRFGFKGIEPKSGYMEWYATSKEAFEGTYFAQGKTEIQPVAWSHWPASAALFLGGFPERVRCAPQRLIGRQSTEGAFLPLLQDAQRRQTAGDKPRALALFHTETTAVVGFTAWGWHPLWEDACLVDIYCHPRHWDKAADLIKSLHLPETERYIAYSDTTGARKTEFFMAHGFKQTVVLKERVARTFAKTAFVDVAVFEKTV